jgi:ribonuclease HI
MPKQILYTDGGCSGNEQLDLTKRKMVAVVSDETGAILVEKVQQGGSNNIAELLAVKEALVWAVTQKFHEVEIRTDSRNNLAWTFGKNVGKKINDRDAVLALKSVIDSCRNAVRVEMKWIPRNSNLAGKYIEQKYTL